MPYIKRLYGIRKKIVPTQKVRSNSLFIKRYVAPNGKAVFIHEIGLEDQKS
jgi:hypothetical protein